MKKAIKKLNKALKAEYKKSYLKVDDNDISTIEMLHDKLLDSGICKINDKMMENSRKLTTRMHYVIIKPFGANPKAKNIRDILDNGFIVDIPKGIEVIKRDKYGVISECGKAELSCQSCIYYKTDYFNEACVNCRNTNKETQYYSAI